MEKISQGGVRESQIEVGNLATSDYKRISHDLGLRKGMMEIAKLITRDTRAGCTRGRVHEEKIDRERSLLLRKQGEISLFARLAKTHARKHARL